MWYDWWTAHRAEIYLSMVSIPLVMLAMLIYFALHGKKKD